MSVTNQQLVEKNLASALRNYMYTKGIKIEHNCRIELDGVTIDTDNKKVNIKYRIVSKNFGER